MTTTKKTLYESYSIEEFRAFIKNRAIHDSKDLITLWTTSISKRLCIAKLEEIDQLATFRFMDLPTELRLHVYRELLLSAPSNLAILQTTKQINAEAQDILYKETVMPLAICAESTRHPSNGHTTLHHGGIGLSDGLDRAQRTLPVANRHSPDSCLILVV